MLLQLTYYHTVQQYCVYRDGYGGLASCPYIREFLHFQKHTPSNDIRVGSMLKSNYVKN